MFALSRRWVRALGRQAAARCKALGRRSLSKGGFTGPRSSFLAEQLNFSGLPFVFSWKILIEQKGLCCSQKFDNAKAGSSALFLNFPFSQVSLCFSLGLFKFVEWVAQGEGMEFSRLSYWRSSQPAKHHERARILCREGIPSGTVLDLCTYTESHVQPFSEMF